MITAGCASRRPREVPPSGRTIVSLHDALNINAAPALREHRTGSSTADGLCCSRPVTRLVL